MVKCAPGNALLRLRWQLLIVAISILKGCSFLCVCVCVFDMAVTIERKYNSLSRLPCIQLAL